MATLRQYRTEDVDDQAYALAGWTQHYEQLGCGRFRGSVWQMVMSDGVLLREHTNRQLREQIKPPSDHLVLAIPLAVEPGSVFAGQPLGRESLMVLSGKEEYDVMSAGELDLIGLSVHRSMLEAGLAPAKIEWLERAERQRSLELLPEVAAAIRYMLLAVNHETTHQLERVADRAHEAELLSSTLTQAVLLAMSGDRSEHASAIPRRASNRQRIVKRAIDFMQAKLYDEIGVPEICTAAYASRRTLQYCFEEFMHTTPQAYLRAMRLNEARRALKLQGDQPITGVASMLGFSSASHFTRHYKLMFDELPSETLKLGGQGLAMR